jgi:hypothetical protein
MFPTLALRLSVRILLAAALLLAVSCSGRKSVYPVRGKVLFEGAPAVGARVQFHPENQSAEQPFAPVGEVDKDGTFRLTTYSHEDGAPAGRYTVTVLWGKPSKGGDGYDQIWVPERYLSPATSKLTADVPEQETELPPFHLGK